MVDPRLETLAQRIIEFSVRLQPGERVLIENFGEQFEFVNSLVRAAYRAGGFPFVALRNHQVRRQLLLDASAEQLAKAAEYDLHRMKAMHAYVGVRGGANANELSDVPGDRRKLFDELYERPVHLDQRVKHTKWCVLRYPTPSMAQSAGLSTEAFEDFYFKVCCLDYAKMARAMEHLKARMERTDRVRLVGPGTDLRFSIKGIPAVRCYGAANLPDGEVFTAPVRESVNGILTINTPSLYQGYTFENIRLEFSGGKITKAAANDTERINAILDTDEGARYIGEFSLGLNPYIKTPMKDILFDEKIDGSFHFTPGECYEDAYNGNKSAIHWDMVVIQRAEYGGGEVWFDDELIRKDGRFVTTDLAMLNPEHLV